MAPMYRLVKLYHEKSRLLAFCILAVLCVNSTRALSQTTSYHQFSPEFQLNRAFSEKWAAEFDLNNTFSNTPTEDKVFKTIIQGSSVLWAHYFFSPRWKFSSGLGYYYNHDQPDMGQYEANEFRFSLVGTYFIHKIGYTLSTKMRADVRYLQNEEGVYEDIYRYRQMLKYIKPFNSQVLRQGVFYGVASEELFFKSTRKDSGFHYFDRNMFAIGGGYMISNDLQVELTYTHEFVPRDNGNILNNLITVSLTTNNLFTNIGHHVVNLLSPAADPE